LHFARGRRRLQAAKNPWPKNFAIFIFRRGSSETAPREKAKNATGKPERFLRKY